MQLLDFLHRWTGGLIGLVLGVLGLTGAILVHRDSWIMLPHADDAQLADVASITAATERLMATSGDPQGIVYASQSLGLHRVRLSADAGLYADQAGNVVARWTSQWERPELWIFDLHHHLFAGDVGETVSGIAGLCALFFAITGMILWWRTRRSFRFRLWPKRMTRAAILTQHRDLGIVVAPLIILSALTGSMMLFRPVAGIILSPLGSPAKLSASLASPRFKGGILTEKPDWSAILATARSRFPEAEYRILSLPRKPGDPIALRMRQPEEWLPNGRTMLWFDAASGQLLGARDSRALPTGARAFNLAYPLHAAKVGGLAYRLAMTFSGLSMAMLGSFAVWSFWFRRNSRVKKPARAALATG